MSATSITIHNTGNPSSSAQNERSWLTNSANDRTASYHIVVDEHGAIECIPLTENAWHAGDGSGLLSGNRTSIGIEICESGDYARTIRNAAELAADMLMERGWGIDRLKRHYDWSGKICPRLMYDNGKWSGWQLFKEHVAEAMRRERKDETMSGVETAALERFETALEELGRRVAELEAKVNAMAEVKIAAPQWFVQEFGSGDLDGLLHEPKLTYEGWRVLAVSMRANVSSKGICEGL